MQKRIDNKEVAFLKNLIKSRRGIAIELAIGVMMLMTAFSIILLTTGTLQAQQRKDDYNNLVQKIEINEIGEYVCENVALIEWDAEGFKLNHFDSKYPNYSLGIDGTEYTIYDNDGEVVLTIGIEKVDGEYTIISWK